MISNFFLPKMQELDFHDMWFQQDGARCHTARVTMDLLRGEFGEHFISRSEPVNWDYVKAHVYTDKHASIDALEDNIEAFIREIPAEMLERVCQNTKQMDHLKGSRGQHLHEIIFKH